MGLEEEIFASLERMPHNFSNVTVSKVLQRVEASKEHKLDPNAKSDANPRKWRWIAPIGAGIVAVAICGIVVEDIIPSHRQTMGSQPTITQLNVQVLNQVPASDIAQVNSVLKKAGFAIKQPTNFPFTVVHTMADLQTLNQNHTMVEITYLGAERQVLQFSATSSAASPSDTSQKVPLANGDVAYFSASQVNSEISWEDQGVYYSLQSQNQGKTVMAKSQLVEIANSVH